MDESHFDSRSPIKCCIGARVDAMDAENSRDKSARFDFRRNKSGEVLRMRSIEPIDLMGVDRF